jgi:hypothetical protein
MTPTLRAVVVYESMFGNTQQIALAIGKGLATGLEVAVVEVGDAGTAGADADLLVVGGPTHAFGLSRASTRQSAAEQATAPVVSTGTGIREWLGSLPAATTGRPAATFDTHLDKPRWLPGSAARGAARQLRRLGYRLVLPPESFYVTGTPGPLLDGELARAEEWGQRLRATLDR